MFSQAFLDQVKSRCLRVRETVVSRGCASVNSCFVLYIQGSLLQVEILHSSVVNGHITLHFAVKINVNVNAVLSTLESVNL